MLLLEKSRSGVNVEIVTSDSDFETHQKALQNLTVGVKAASQVALLPLLILGTLVLTFAFNLNIIAAAVISLIFAPFIASFLSPALEYKLERGKVKITPSKELIHSKIFIIDDSMAIVGSANLTKSGMERNFEHIEIKDNVEDVQQLIGTFKGLW